MVATLPYQKVSSMWLLRPIASRNPNEADLQILVKSLSYSKRARAPSPINQLTIILKQSA